MPPRRGPGAGRRRRCPGRGCARSPPAPRRRRAGARTRPPRPAAAPQLAGRRRRLLVDHQPRLEAVAVGLEGGLLDRLAPQARRRRAVDLLRGQGLDQGGDGDVGGDAGLHVHPPHLDRAEPRVRPHVPPEVGVVGDAGGDDQLVGDAEEFLVVAEGARHFEARVAGDDRGAGAGEAGVGAFAEGRVGGSAPAAAAGGSGARWRPGPRFRGRACRRGRGGRRAACRAGRRGPRLTTS